MTKTVDCVEQLKNESLNQIEVTELARNLERYSRLLDSPLLIGPYLLAGDTESIPRIGRAIGAGGRALGRLAPLLDGKTNYQKATDLERLMWNAALMQEASSDLSIFFDEFANVNFTGFLRFFNPKIEPLQAQSLRYQEVFENISPLIPILPQLLGNESKRSYFIAMQNSAQARGTGGLVGAFAIISVEKATLKIDLIAPNSVLKNPGEIPINLPKEYRDVYKFYASTWNGSNFSPHFPYAAQIWAESWRRMSGQRVDGVIALDTFFLKAVLKASGQINYRGFVVNHENVIDELLSNAYVRFESDSAMRKKYLADVAGIAARRLISGHYSTGTLLREMVDPILENRIHLYFMNPKEQKAISLSRLSGELDGGANNEYRLVVQNIAGNKLDYYISRELTIMSESCLPTRTTRVDFTITNTANPEVRLPPYVNSLRAQGFPMGLKNSQYVGAFLYGPSFSKITGVIDADTGETYGSVYKERNRPFYSVQIQVPAGASKRFTVFFEGGTGKLNQVLQPLVLPQETLIVDNCNI